MAEIEAQPHEGPSGPTDTCPKPGVFLEAATLQWAVRSRRLLYPRAQQIPGWPTLYELVEDGPAAKKAKGKEMRAEVDLLPRIAELKRRGEIELLSHMEAQFEYLGAHFLGDGPSLLIQAGVKWVKSPIPYSRIIVGPSVGEARTMRINFLKGIRHPRFLEIQRACGVYQGNHINEKQLPDAWHIWCAEEAGAKYFLTLDLALVRLVSLRKKAPPRVQVVAPSGLLRRLGHAVP